MRMHARGSSDRPANQADLAGYSDLSGRGLAIPRHLRHSWDVSITAERIRNEAAALSSEERAELAHFLLQSLDPTENSEFQAEWDEELERRADEIRSGLVAGIPAEQAFEQLRSRFK